MDFYGDLDNPPSDTATTYGDSKAGPSEKCELTRRGFVTTLGAFTGGLAVGIPIGYPPAIEAEVHRGDGENAVAVEMTINGEPQRLSLDPRVTLLDLLREELALFGTKKGCDHGQCGACTVLVNGRRINSCLSLAVVHHGDEITTIEGLAKGDDLHPLQAAFLEHDGFQCGYCTPGQICSAIALLSEAKRGDASLATPDLSRISPIELTGEEIRERMSGNICRCGAYPGIVEAVQTVDRRDRAARDRAA